MNGPDRRRIRQVRSWSWGLSVTAWLLYGVLIVLAVVNAADRGWGGYDGWAGVRLLVLFVLLLIGWVAVRTLSILGQVLARVDEQAEAASRAADMIEWRIGPGLERLADAVERLSAETSAAVPKVDLDDLRAQLNAARDAYDAERVVDLRTQIAGHLEGEPIRELDREVIAWLMTRVRRGLAEVPVRADVVALATRVAEVFPHLPEGASLRKSLPVLRRSVGLCPRCAQPYGGADDACPECLGSTPTGWPADDPELVGAPRPTLLVEAGIEDEEPNPSESGEDGEAGPPSTIRL